MATAEFAEGDAREALDRTVKDMVAKVDRAWEQCPEEVQASTDSNKIWEVYEQHDADLEKLSFLMRHIKRPRGAGTANRRADGGHDVDRLFRKWVLDRQRPRAKILAAILSIGSEGLIAAWDGIMSQFHRPAGNADQAAFSDHQLPFSPHQIRDFFRTLPDAASRGLSDAQHKFCPVDRAKINVNCYKIFDDLRRRVERDAIIEYEIMRDSDDRKGEGRRGSREMSDEDKDEDDLEAVAWSPEEKVQQLFRDESDMVRSLYIGWCGRERPDRFSDQPNHRAALREYHDKVIHDAEVFYRGIQSRERILATLLIATSAESEAFTSFVECCLNLETRGTLTDQELPLSKTDVKKHFGDDYVRNFYNQQFRFCPIKLKWREEVQWKQPGTPPLPLLEMGYLNRGSFGKVYSVRVMKGYFPGYETERFAMKVIESDRTDTITEWHVGHKVLLQNNFPRDSLAVPLALVRAKSRVYIFMELADCNLKTLIEGVQTTERLTTRQLKLHGNLPKAPENNQDRLEKLHWMLEVAKALAALHSGVWTSETDATRQQLVMHGDVKSTNILYTKGKSGKCPLQLADFGVSSLRYMPQDGPYQNPVSKDKETDHEMKTKLGLSMSCSNFPPEAELDGRGGQSGDLWGLGVAFSEYLAWMSGGPTNWQEFNKFRNESNDHHDDIYNPLSYYRTTRTSPEARVKDGIGRWFRKLISNTNDPKDKHLYDCCWYLLEHGLLVCDPVLRIKCDVLVKALTVIRGMGSREQLERLVPSTSEPDRDDAVLDTVLSHRSRYSQHRTASQSSGADQSIRSLGKMSTDASHSTFEAKNKPSPGELGQALGKRDVGKAVELISRGADLRVFLPRDRITCLHLAVNCSQVEATKELLERDPDLAVLQDREGLTAAHLCANGSMPASVEHARLIVEKKPEVLDIRDVHKRTPYAIAMGRPRVPKGLREVLKPGG